MRLNQTTISRLNREVELLEKLRGDTSRFTFPKFTPHPGQLQVIEESRRFNVLCMGRRWGKTLLAINLLLEPAKQGFPVAWFSPVYRSIAEVWLAFLYYLGDSVKAKNAQERRIELYTGGSIEFWSLEKSPNLVRGRKYKRVVIDETALIPKIKQTWYMVIRPCLTDFEGDGYLLSTPYGFNDFYDFWLMGQSEKFPEWVSWTMPTHTNPYISPAELETIRSETPSRMFAQEYLAEFLPSLSGGMFTREWFQIVDSVPRGGFKRKVRSWDLAGSTGDSADFTVGTLLGEGTGENPGFYVLDVIRGKWTPANRDNLILETARRDGKEVPIVIEQEPGQSGVSQLRSLSRMLAGFRVVPVKPSGDKATRAEPFASQVENGNVYLLRGKWNSEFLSELEGFPDPLLLHDDQVDSVSYAFNHFLEPGGKPFYIIGGYTG